jgi:hypothetical protein
LTILLHFLAQDAVDAAEATAFDPVMPRVTEHTCTTFDEQFRYYDSVDFDVKAQLSDCLSSRLRKRARYFDVPQYSSDSLLVNDAREQKLKQEHPAIWQAFGLDDISRGESEGTQ